MTAVWFGLYVEKLDVRGRQNGLLDFFCLAHPVEGFFPAGKRAVP